MEWDYLTGGPLMEDPLAYSADRQTYSEWSARVSPNFLDDNRPGGWKSWMPVWGSVRDAQYNRENGEWVQWAANMILAAEDLTGVGFVAKTIGKGIAKAAARSAARETLQHAATAATRAAAQAGGRRAAADAGATAARRVGLELAQDSRGLHFSSADFLRSIGEQACFVAGTRVMVDRDRDGDGDLESAAIEDIRAGDYVLARDQHDPGGPVRRRRVARVFRKTADHLRVLEIRDGEGNVETIRTTDEHPFWVEGIGWVAAKDLAAGMRLDQPDGSDAVVIATAYEAHPEGVLVFNFEVEGDHTYFVEDGGGEQTAVWVHNVCKFGSLKEGRDYWNAFQTW